MNTVFVFIMQNRCCGSLLPARARREFVTRSVARSIIVIESLEICNYCNVVDMFGDRFVHLQANSFPLSTLIDGRIAPPMNPSVSC